VTQGRELLPGQISIAHAVTRPRPGIVEAEARFRGWDGKVRRVRRSAPTKGQAKALAFQAAQALLNRTEVATGNEESTLELAISTHLANLKRDARVRPQTIRIYSGAVKRICGVAGDLPISRLTPSLLARHLHEAYQGVPAQHRQALIVVKGTLRAAVAEGLINRNPAAELMPPRKKNPEPRALDAEALALLLYLLHTTATDELTGAQIPVPNVYSDLALLQAAIGGRVGEIAALEWSSTEMGEGAAVVTIAGTVVSAVAGGSYRQEFAKTARSARRIRITDPTVIQMLQRRRAERQANQNRMFAGVKGGYLSPHTINAYWRKHLKGTELQGWTTHTLRSTYVTRRALGGAPLPAVSAAVGHTSVSTTRRYYEAVDPNRIFPAE
jgi:integrase